MASVVAVVVAVWLFALIYDRRRTYKYESHRLFLIEKIALGEKSPEKLSEGTIKNLLAALDGTPTDESNSGQPAGAGMTSSLLALLTLTLVALALATLLVSGASDAADLRKTIITSLLSILASIAGFYFGARTAQTSAAQSAVTASSGSGSPSPGGDETPRSAIDISGMATEQERRGRQRAAGAQQVPRKRRT